MKQIPVVIFLILILAASASAMSIQPNSWAETVSQSQVLSKTFTFLTVVNESQSLTLASSGLDAAWVTLSKGTITASNGSSESITATASVPSSASAGRHDVNVTYSGTTSGTLTFSFFVQAPQQQGGCQLIPFPSSYRKSIQQGSMSSKNIIIQVSQQCPGPVTFKNIDLTGGIVTGSDNLDRPFRIEEENLGMIQPGGEFNIPLVLDTKEVETGTYDTILDSVDAKRDIIKELCKPELDSYQGGKSDLKLDFFNHAILQPSHKSLAGQRLLRPHLQ